MSRVVPLSKKRKLEIIRLVNEGGDDVSPDVLEDASLYEKYRRRVRREMMNFASSATNSEELHFFAERWDWDGDVKPLFRLVKNPNCDAGTLLAVFWRGNPESYYRFHMTPRELPNGNQRDIYTLLRRIEKVLLAQERGNAKIRFNPRSFIFDRANRENFARPIPDRLYKPIG